MTDTRNEWALDREIVITRVYDAPRELVFEAWTNPEHIVRWFGPNGFEVTTHEIDLRVGGRWRFDFRGPDGTHYSNRMVFEKIERPTLLVFEHGSDVDDDPGRFRMTVTFDEQSNGKTVVTLRQLHPTAEQRAHVIGFGAVELGFQTLDKLAAHVAGMHT
ncbi:MAG: SRPBCC domain-containing protein [Sandaracinus sp.]|nr:SRPBCC domain-containing protein [Sandaracinus sp.]MCB9618856.1 SRPBCC domain-containing protein [Sandaracinus sp.]MCB9635410.1 SRPBCC domain-containing protein [Sandaracinus sp.]